MGSRTGPGEDKKGERVMKIFLDDIRQPKDCLGYMYQRIGPDNFLYLEEWIVVKNFDEFQHEVIKNGPLITHISWDHDLADSHYALVLTDTEGEYSELEKTLVEKTGKDCAQWFKEYWDNQGWPYPKMFVHSQNPIGLQNIINVFKDS